MNAPDGYKLIAHEGYYVNDQGFRITPDTEGRRPVMPDGQIEVPHFDENNPFIFTSNDGMGLHASEEAKEAARAGEPMEGWNPNVVLKPIKDGWMPPAYTLQEKGRK